MSVQPDLLPVPLLLPDAEAWRTVLAFTVIGVPAGWARARVSTRGARPRIFNDPKTELAEERYRSAAALCWRGSPLEVPVGVEVVARFSRPGRLKKKSHRGTAELPYDGKPDPDNIVKAVLDGITRSGAWRDDKQVADLVCRRRYLPLDALGVDVGLPRVDVRVWTL